MKWCVWGCVGIQFCDALLRVVLGLAGSELTGRKRDATDVFAGCVLFAIASYAVVWLVR